GDARVAAQVDQVGAGASQGPRLGEQFGQGEARGVVDLREDGNVEGAVVRGAAAASAEELGQVAQVPGPALDRDAGAVGDGLQVAAAQAGEDDAVDAGRNFEVAGDPGRGGEGDDRDRQDGDAAVEAGAGGQVGEGAAQGGFGELPGDEEE